MSPRVWIGLAIVVATLCVVWWIFDTGRDVERGKQAERTIEENDDARRERERAERDASGRSDGDLLKRLCPRC